MENQEENNQPQMENQSQEQALVKTSQEREEKNKKEEKKKKKKLSFKTKVIFAQTILILLILAGVFVYYKLTSQKINEATRLVSLDVKINKEIETCRGLMNKSQGDFSKYEYCKQLLKVFE